MEGIKYAKVTPLSPRGLVQANPLYFSEKNVKEFLKKNGVNTRKFGEGRAKTLAEIAAEMSAGESALLEAGPATKHRRTRRRQRCYDGASPQRPSTVVRAVFRPPPDCIAGSTRVPSGPILRSSKGKAGRPH